MIETELIKEEAAEGERRYWQNMAKAAQEAVLTAIQNEDTPPAALVSAAKEVWDRAYGKVADKHELSGEVKLNLNLENGLHGPLDALSQTKTVS